MYMKSWIINTIIAICLATGMGFAQVPYQIEGKWATGIGKKVYLSNFPADTPEAVTIDSTIVAPDGSYKLSGKLDKMQLLSLPPRCRLFSPALPRILSVCFFPDVFSNHLFSR